MGHLDQLKERLKQCRAEKRFCHANIDACNEVLQRISANNPAYMSHYYEKNEHKDRLVALMKEENKLLEKIESLT